MKLKLLTTGPRKSLARCSGLLKAILILCGAGLCLAGRSVYGGTNVVSSAGVSNAATTYPGFRLHPFAATKVSGPFQWTSEDGTDTNIIQQIAHNDHEYHRMVLENKTIYRRQLVYFNNSFASRAQNAVQAHQGIEQITLPGLDGQTFTVHVTKTDFRNGGSKGRIYGHLQDDPDSMVTVAFVNDREAFTIISARDQVYLQAESREPGEVIVKSINPKTYGVPGN